MELEILIKDLMNLIKLMQLCVDYKRFNLIRDILCDISVILDKIEVINK